MASFLDLLNDPVERTEGDSAFTQGLRSGFSGLRGQATAALGGLAEGAGFDNVGRELYKSAEGLSMDAAEQAPPIQSYKDVHDLRSGFDYTTGLIGQSLPTMVPAVAASLIAKRPIMAATGAMAVPEVGDVIQRQQADPATAALPMQERLPAAVGGGVASAAAQSLVPAYVGKQILGKTAAATAKNTLQQRALRAAGATVGEGTTEAGSEAIKAVAAGQEIDPEALKEAFVGGAVAGTGMTVPGAAVEALHGAASRAGTTVADAAKGAYKKAKDVTSLLAPKDTATARAMAGDELLDPVPEGGDPAAHVADNDAKMTTKAKEWLESQLADSSLSDENKAKVQDLLNRASDPAARMEVGSRRLADEAKTKANEFYDITQKAFKKGAEKIDAVPALAKVKAAVTPYIEKGTASFPKIAKAIREFGTGMQEGMDFVKQWKEANPTGTGDDFIKAFQERFPHTKKSADYSGTRDIVTDAIRESIFKSSPELMMDEESMGRVADSISAYVEAAKDGNMPEREASAVAYLRMYLGADTIKVLENVFKAVHKGTPKEREQFYDSLQKGDEEATGYNKVAEVVKRGIRDKNVPVEDAVEALRLYVRGDHVKQLSGNERVIREKLVKGRLQEIFGGNLDTVLEAFEKEYDDTKPKSKVEADTDEDDGDTDEENGKSDEEKAKSKATAENLEAVELEYEPPRVYPGKGKVILSHEAHARKYGNDNSQHNRVMEQANKENTDRSVSFMSVKDYNYAYDDDIKAPVSPDHPDYNDYGVVVAEGQKQEGRVAVDQANEFKANMGYHRKDAHVPVEKHGVTLDAVRLTRKTLADLPFIDGENQMRRTARAFLEGLGGALIHYDTNIKGKLPDSLVIFARKDKGGVITYGDIKNLKDEEGTEMSTAAKLDMASDIQDLRLELGKTKSKADREDILDEISLLQYLLDKREMTGTTYRGVDEKGNKFVGVRKSGSDDDVSVAGVKDKLQVRELDPEGNIHLAALEHENRGTLSRNAKNDVSASTKQRVKNAKFEYVQKLQKRLTELDKEADKDKIKEIKRRIKKYSPEKSEHIASKNEFTDDTRPEGPIITRKGPMVPFEGNRPVREGEEKETAPVEKTKEQIKAEALAADASVMAKTRGNPKAQAKALMSGEIDISQMATITHSGPMHVQTVIDRLLDTRAKNERESDNANRALRELNRYMTEALKKSPELAYALQSANSHGIKYSRVMFSKLGNIERYQALLDKGHAEIRDGAIFITNESELPNDMKNKIAFTDKNDNIVINEVAAQREIDNGFPHIMGEAGGVISRQKKVVADRMGWTRESLKKLFPDLKTFVQFLRMHEQSHIDNHDREVYPKDFMAPEAIDIEVRASQDALNAGPDGPDNAKNAEEYINRVLPHIKVLWDRLTHAGQFEPGAVPNAMDTIRLSIHALNPMSVAYHESLHAFFKGLRDQKNHAVMKVLQRAADSAPVLNQLKKLLANEPEALKQLSDPEERVAYMYQFYQQGKLKLGTDTRNMLQRIKDFIMKVMGLWTNDRRAEHIMDWFYEGNFKENHGDANAVARALMMPGTNAWIEKGKKLLGPLSRMQDALLSTGAERMRDTENPALVKLAHMIAPETGAEASDVGYLQASKNEFTVRMNALAKSLKGVSNEDMTAAHALLKEGRRDEGDNSDQTRAMKAVRQFLDDSYDYMTESGVAVRDRGRKKDYFPRVWDVDLISKNQKEFIEMLERVKARGVWKGDPYEVMHALLSHDGSEDGVEVNMPGQQHTKRRKLDFITSEDSSPFVERSLMRTLASYANQSSRRAEWAKRFGDDGMGMRALLDEAKEQHGATDEEIDMAQNFIRSVNGTLGDDISPFNRRLFGNLIVYQNIRLLPLAIFSQFVDPGGIMVRGGTLGDAFNAFKRGITEIPRGFKKNKEKDEWYELAETLGVIDDVTLTHALGTSYTQGMVSDTARKWNDKLFQFNLVEQFTMSMRVGALQAATRFLARHADGTYSPHSVRWLEELGLKPGDITVDADGKVVSNLETLEKMGVKDAVEKAAKTRAALNKWVDGAILRPSAANKPIWMNDPHYALFAHLKQFVYAFQDTILKRAWNEAAYGNYGPAITLAGYVPMMLAADLLKGMIQGGGEQPQWKKGWTAQQYLGSAVERAGLYGVSQFGSDLIKGKTGLLGPTVEQGIDAVKVMGSKHTFESFALRSLPANALYAHIADNDPVNPEPNYTR